MILSGTMIGFICVAALLMAAILAAILDKKEKSKGNMEKSKFLSRLALGLFIAAFVGGVAVTLSGGIRPREGGGGITGGPMGNTRGGGMGGGMPAGGPSMAGIGSVDQKEVEALEEKVAKDPKDVRSRERLGHLYLQQQDFENVFRLAHEAIQLDPNSTESRAHLGMVLFSMGELDQSLNQFDKALAIDPKATEVLLYKGIVQFQGKNDLKGAKETWEYFLKVAKASDPGIPRVKMFLEMINSQPQ